MTYKLHREVVDEKVTRLSLGVVEVDAYLKFLQYRCRANTWISYGYDLQIYLNFIRKPLLEVTSADILAFVDSQQSAPNRQGRTNGSPVRAPAFPTGQLTGGLPRWPASTNISEFFMTFPVRIIRCRGV